MVAVALVALSLAAQAMPRQAPRPAGSPVPAAEQRICKRTTITGSISRTRRECRTRAEWDLIAWAARQNGEDMIQRNAGLITGN